MEIPVEKETMEAILMTKPTCSITSYTFLINFEFLLAN